MYKIHIYGLYYIQIFVCHMRLIALFILILVSGVSRAQLLQWSPSFIKESSTSVIITCDASKGNLGLSGYTPTSDVYVHIGAITSLSSGASDWKYVVNSNFNTPAAIVQASYAGNDKWTFMISGGLRTFFNITNTSEKILKIAILFRSGNGGKVQRNSDGSDMYVPVYDDGLYTRIDTPLMQPFFKMIPQTIAAIVGDTIKVSAVGSSSSTMRILFNGNSLTTVSAATLVNANAVISAPGTQTIIAEAVSGSVTSRDTIRFLVTGSVNTAALPTGIREGINYEPGDTSVILVLYAPGKNKASVAGDFNNWTESLSTQMNRTPDGNQFWLRITGLAPGTEYAYQYMVDGSIKVADYNTEKILDPDNDQYIPSATYPNLKAYPTGKTTGIVSILQTAKPAYNWQVTNFTRPDKKNLVIYELLIRDFVTKQNFQTLKDSLPYLKKLGINAIELMPFNEFEGNLSWGYNPNFQFAPDKFYGTETAIKQFIDACHQQGIAVIMDMVMNHCMGSSPLAQLYWDAANNRPAANNPWLNATATHPYNVGNDFNHESQATKNLTARIVRHWLTNYKIDGFRWDLSKGFTQVNNPTDVSAWSNYDASRVATWKRIYDTMQQVSPASYCILEHFAANTEETELANYGMLIWGNQNYSFNQATMGYNTGSDFSGALSKNKNWNLPLLVAYQESHDEERLMFKNLSYGNIAGTYAVKDTATALKRQEMAAAFWSMIPGPKMLWQFGELGYHTSINTCSNGTIDAGGGCRTVEKPIRWDYYQQTARKTLYDVYAKLIKLKLTPGYKTTFTTNAVTASLAGNVKWLQLLDDSLQVMVIGNFDVNSQTAAITFPTAGTWYSYLTNATRTATGVSEQITLQPGEYYVYTNRNITNAVITAIGSVNNYLSDIPVSIIPNPVMATAVIRYQLPESAQVKITLEDMAGRSLGTVFQGFKPAGIQKLTLHTNQLSIGAYTNGVYLLKITHNKKTRVEKFFLLR